MHLQCYTGVLDISDVNIGHHASGRNGRYEDDHTVAAKAVSSIGNRTDGHSAVGKTFSEDLELHKGPVHLSPFVKSEPRNAVEETDSSSDEGDPHLKPS